MLLPYITIRNISDTPRELKDVEIPGGRVVIPPGAEFPLVRSVYQRRVRANSSWMLVVGSSRDIPQLAKSKPVVQEVKSVEVETAETEDEQVAEIPKMQELRAMAKELGIPAKIGITRAELYAAIEAATRPDTEEEISDEEV